MGIPASDISSWTDTQINCAVPTGVIADYSASAGSGNVVVTSADGLNSNGFPFNTSFGYGAHRWALWGTTFYVNPAGTSVLARQAAVDAAASTWNAAGSAFHFSNLGQTTVVPARDGVNVISWADGMPDGVIGTAWSYWDASGNVTECDIKFSNAFAWGDGSPGSSTMDLQTIATHELGHWLRLLDQYGSGDAGKVMYGYGALERQTHYLSWGDATGIRWIYPQMAPSVTRSPSSSAKTYKRKKGVARYSLYATLHLPAGLTPAGQRVYLQSSANGRTKWKTIYRLTTNRAGMVVRSFKAKKKGTVYYRWSVLPSSRTLAAVTNKQKIVIK